MIQDLRVKESKIFEKTAQRGGKLFRIRFVVIERNGVLRGRIISCELLQEETPLLASAGTTGSAVVGTRKFLSIRAPFFWLDFLTSIHIRAPAGAV